MTTIDLSTVVSSKCDLKMVNVGSGSDGWRAFMRELEKDMPSIVDVVTRFNYKEHCELFKMPDDWYHTSTIGRFAADPSTVEEAQRLLENIYTVYTSYVESRTPRLLQQEHASTMYWLLNVLQTAGEDNLAEILVSFFTDMMHGKE